MLITITAMAALPLLQVHGWAKREQLRRAGVEGRIDSRRAALSLLTRSASPQLYPLPVTGRSGATFEILVASLRAGADGLSIPSWRALRAANNIGAGELRCEGGWTHGDTSGPLASTTCSCGRIRLRGGISVLSANLLDAQVQLESEQNAALVVLGGMKIKDALTINAPGQTLEIIALGGVELQSLRVNAGSLLIRSMLGDVSLERPSKTSCVLIEAPERIVVDGITREIPFGCPLQRGSALWPDFELAGEREGDRY